MVVVAVEERDLDRAAVKGTDGVDAAEAAADDNHMCWQGALPPIDPTPAGCQLSTPALHERGLPTACPPLFRRGFSGEDVSALPERASVGSGPTG